MAQMGARGQSPCKGSLLRGLGDPVRDGAEHAWDTGVGLERQRQVLAGRRRGLRQAGPPPHHNTQ